MGETGKPKDLPRDELVVAADRAIGRYGPNVAAVHFKFTCEHCGNRCTFGVANTLFELGECDRCGLETRIEKGGFMLVLTMPKREAKNEPEPPGTA